MLVRAICATTCMCRCVHACVCPCVWDSVLPACVILFVSAWNGYIGARVHLQCVCVCVCFHPSWGSFRQRLHRICKNINIHAIARQSIAQGAGAAQSVINGGGHCRVTGHAARQAGQRQLLWPDGAVLRHHLLPSTRPLEDSPESYADPSTA